MWTVLSEAIAIGLAALALSAGPTGALSFEAEDLARKADISGGGDLLVIAAPDDGRLEFGGGRALTFVPRGKGAQLELIVPVRKAGVYRLVIRAVAGPSCGIYRLVHRGKASAGWFNLMAEHAALRPRLRSRRLRLAAGDNRIVFRYVQGGRGSCLVLDSLELVPHVPPPPPKPDPYDGEIPAGEERGPELLTNAGFEQFTPSDRFERMHQRVRCWTFNSVVPEGVGTIVRDAAKARSGTRAICLSPDPLDDHAILYQTFRAETGKRYRVSFYARGTGFIRVDFYQYGGRPQHGDSLRTQNHFKLTEDWQLYSFIMSPSKSGNVNSVAIALHGVTGGAAYFDDVSVREVLH